MSYGFHCLGHLRCPGHYKTKGRDRLKIRHFDIVVLVICIGIVGGAWAFSVEKVAEGVFGLAWPGRCFLYHTFGIRCALCGMTRSFCAITACDITGAIRYHHLGPIVFGFIIFQIPYRIWTIVTSPKQRLIKVRKTHAVLGGLILVAVFVDWLIYLWGRLL